MRPGKNGEEIQLYLTLGDDGNANEKRTGAILRYCIGNEGRAIIETNSTAKAEDQAMNKYMDALGEYCKPKGNLVLDTCIFLTRKPKFDT